MNSIKDIKLDTFFTKICSDVRMREPGPGLKNSILENISKVKPQREPDSGVSFQVNRLFPAKMIPAASLVAAVLMVTVICSIFPGFAEAVKNYIVDLALGKRTHIVQINPNPGDLSGQKGVVRLAQGAEKVELLQPADETAQERGRKTWRLATSVGSFEGAIPEAGNSSMVTYNTIYAARRFLPGLLYPAHLPRRYEFQKAVLAPSKDIFLFFSGPGGEILLHQSIDKKSAVASVTLEPMVERLKLDGGSEAVWTSGGHNLIWERDDVSFSLGGRMLSKEEAVKIAGSIKQQF